MSKKNVHIDIKSSDKNIVDCFVRFGELSFFLTFVYGEPVSEGRSVVYDRLIRIGIGRVDSWSIISYFNEILNNDKNTEGPHRPEVSFKCFSEMLSACGVEELSSKGNIFTWEGRRWMQCCLDKCFANKAWLLKFPGSNQTFLEMRGSDHRPMWVNLRANAEAPRGQFRFDRRLAHHPDAIRDVENAWEQNKGNVPISVRIRKCGSVMSEWKRRRGFNAREKITLLQERLKWFQSKPYSCWFVINNLKKELMQAYREEKIIWRQKCREKWLKLGDLNFSFISQLKLIGPYVI